MIKSILFDLDNTLYSEMQFVRGGFKAVSPYISKHNNTSQNTVYQLLLDVLEKHGRGNTFNITLKQLGIYSETLIPKLVEIYRTHKPNLLLYPEIRTALSILKKQGYKLGLITDGNVEVQRNKVKALKIKDFFDCLIFSDKYGIEMRKPGLFSYQRALERLTVSPNESIYIGDNPYKDFVNAKKVGIYTVRVMRGQYKSIKLDREYEANYQVKNLNGIFDILCSL